MFPELLRRKSITSIAKVREWDQANAATATNGLGVARAGDLCLLLLRKASSRPQASAKCARPETTSAPKI